MNGTPSDFRFFTCCGEKKTKPLINWIFVYLLFIFTRYCFLFYNTIGKRLKVTLAKPRNEVKFNTNVYVSGLPLDTTEQQFADLCEQYGRIVEVRLLTSAASQGSHNTLAAFVRFNKRYESDAFIAAAHGLPIPGFSPQSSATVSGTPAPSSSSPSTNGGTSSSSNDSSNGSGDNKSGTNRRTWVLSARYATDNRTRYKEATGAWLTNSAVDRRANNLLNELAQQNPSSAYSNPKMVSGPLSMPPPFLGNPGNPNSSLHPSFNGGGGGPPPASSPRSSGSNPTVNNMGGGNPSNTPFQRFPPTHSNPNNPGFGQSHPHHSRRGNHHNNNNHSSNYSNNRNGIPNRNLPNNSPPPNTQYSTNHPQAINSFYIPSGALNHPPHHPTTPYWAHPGYENPSGYPAYPPSQSYFAPGNAPLTSLPPGVVPQWNPNYPVRNTGDNNSDRGNDNNPNSSWRGSTGITETNSIGNSNTTSNEHNVPSSNGMDPTMRALDEQLRGLNMNNHNQPSSTVPPNSIPILSTPNGNIALVSAPYGTLSNDPNNIPQHVLNQFSSSNTNSGNNNVGYTAYPAHPYGDPYAVPQNNPIAYSTAIYPGAQISTELMKNTSNFSSDPNAPAGYFSIRNVPKNNVNTSSNNNHTSEHKDNP